MHSFLIAFAYLSMIFLPCACAQWGDVLTANWWSMKFGRDKSNFGRAIGVNAYGESLSTSIRSQRAAAEIQTLAEAAFLPAHKPALPVIPGYVQVLLDAQQTRQMRKVAQSDAVKRAAVQVAARLAAITEAHRLANSTTYVVPATAIQPGLAAAAERVAAASAKLASEPVLLYKPPMRSVPAMAEMMQPVAITSGQQITLATPSAAQLEALYALRQETDSGETAAAAVATPPISVAA